MEIMQITSTYDTTNLHLTELHIDTYGYKRNLLKFTIVDTILEMTEIRKLRLSKLFAVCRYLFVRLRRHQ